MDWKKVPTDPVENVNFRLKLYTDLESSPSLRAGFHELCRLDIRLFVNCFVWQVNHRHIGDELGPFILYDWQAEALEKTAHRLWVLGKDVIWEKSRFQGASWMAIILKTHRALFFPWQKFLAFSHLEKAVYVADDPDTLFWKVKFIHDRLPDFISRGAVLKGAKSPRLVYPATKSSFTGQAATKKTGVGGRATSILSDEVALQDRANEIIGNTRDTGPRLFVSTHYGVGTAFYSLCKRPDAFKIIMHWSGHPEQARGLYRSLGDGKYEIIDKSYVFPPDYPFVTNGDPTGGPCPGLRSPWYDEECHERREKDVRQHLDIDPAGSEEQFFDPRTIAELKRTYGDRPDWQGDVVLADGKIDSWAERRSGIIRIWGFRPAQNFSAPAGRFAIGCDVSQGQGATPSVLSLGNANTSEKIMEVVSSRLSPHDFAEYAVAMARFFNNAKLVWEIPGPGLAMGNQIITLGYSNIWYRVEDQGYHVNPQTSDRPGWVNNRRAKLDLLTEYRNALEKKLLINRSEDALLECLNFRYIEGGWVEHSGEKGILDGMGGAGVSHGDITIADALMWKMIQEIGPEKTSDQETMNRRLGSYDWRMARLEELDRLNEDGEELPEWASEFSR